jgi:hypothetical protein
MRKFLKRLIRKFSPDNGALDGGASAPPDGGSPDTRTGDGGTGGSQPQQPQQPPEGRTYAADEFQEVVKQRDEAKKKARDLEAQQQEQERQKLENQKEFENLYQKEKDRAEKLQTELDDSKKTRERDRKVYELGLEAKAQGIADVRDAEALIDLETITVQDGKVMGVKEAVEKLKTDKPYLFGQKPVGTDSSRPRPPDVTTREEILKSPMKLQKLKDENPAEYDRIVHGG